VSPASNPRASRGDREGHAFGADADGASSEGSSSAQKTAGFVIAGLGAVTTSAGVFFAVQFSAKNDALANLCTPSQPCADRARYTEARDSASTARTLAIAGLAGGAAALGTGLVLLLTAASPEGGATLSTGQRSRAPAGIGALHVAPQWGAAGTGVVAGGTW
jgi:hypothetical protein